MSLFIRKKRERVACKMYYRWAATQPCSACGSHENVDAHHSVSRGRADGDDTKCVPLCRLCHALAHACKGTALFFEQRGKSLAMIVVGLHEKFLREVGKAVQVVAGETFEETLRNNGLTDKPYTARRDPFRIERKERKMRKPEKGVKV